MGIYFIAAGSSSNNRQKSLDKGFTLNELQEFLQVEDINKLKKHFPSGENIFIWGANDGRSFNELENVSIDEYVVDVKNTKVIQIFKFCFYINTRRDSRIQRYIGWDEEKPEEQRRSYKYVFFLKNPRPPGREQREKEYYQNAFNEGNSQWLVGQRWFSGSQVSQALQQKGVSTIEEILWG